MTQTKTKPNASALRILSIIDLLKGRSLNGLSHGEIAKSLKTNPTNVSRDLSTLIESGFVGRLENDRYALSVKFLQIARAHEIEMHGAKGRINELESRVEAGAR